MNQITLIGNLGSDIEKTPTKNGGIMGKFSLAVQRPYKQNGEYETDWFSCVLFQENENLTGRVMTLDKLAGKGNKIAVIGNVTISTDGDGKRYFNVNVEKFDILTFKEKNEDTEQPEPKDENNFFGDISEDSIPF